MRTAPVALAYLDDAGALAAAARAVSSLTHWDDDAGDACVLWCLAIRHAVLDGEFDLGGRARRSARGAPHDVGRADRRGRGEAAVRRSRENGWVVHAFQAAWSAIVHTRPPDGDPPLHLRLAARERRTRRRRHRHGRGIAGQLLGARWGASAVPLGWREMLHGWPGITGRELADRGAALASAGAV